MTKKIHNLETQLTRKISDAIIFLYFLKNLLSIFSSKTIFNIFFKIDNITQDRDPNRAKIQDPDPNSMYLDPQP